MFPFYVTFKITKLNRKQDSQNICSNEERMKDISDNTLPTMSKCFVVNSTLGIYVNEGVA